jgi:hypothetical protein
MLSYNAYEQPLQQSSDLGNQTSTSIPIDRWGKWLTWIIILEACMWVRFSVDKATLIRHVVTFPRIWLGRSAS